MKILKKIPAILLVVVACVFALHANAQFTNGQVLTAPALNAALAAPTITGGTITGAPISGSSGSFTTLTASGAVTLPSGSISLSALASQAANTVMANVTGSSASPTAFVMPSCATSSSALNYTLGTGWGCNTAINASSLGGNAASTYAPLASPALTGTPTAPTAAAGTNTTQLASTAFAQTAVTGGGNAGKFTSVTNTGLTANGFAYPSTGGLMASTAAATNGQLLIGSTGAAPVAATLTGTANQISISNGAGTITFSLPSTLAIPGVVSSVNNVSAVSTCNGVPVIVADTLNTFANEGANIPQTTIYTVPSGQGGRYRLTGKTVVTTPASGGTPSSTLPNMTTFATDEDSGGAISANLGSTSTGNTLAAWATGSSQFDAAANTNIQVQTNSYATAGTTSMKYKARFVLEYLCQ